MPSALLISFSSRVIASVHCVLFLGDGTVSYIRVGSSGIPRDVMPHAGDTLSCRRPDDQPSHRTSLRIHDTAEGTEWSPLALMPARSPSLEFPCSTYRRGQNAPYSKRSFPT